MIPEEPDRGNDTQPVEEPPGALEVLVSSRAELARLVGYLLLVLLPFALLAYGMYCWIRGPAGSGSIS